MAISISGASSEGYDSNQYTLSHNCTSGTEMLLVGVSINASPTVNSMTFNGDTVTNQFDVNNTGDCRAMLWYRINPDIGTYNVVANLSGSTRGVMGAYNVTGINTASPFGNTGSYIHDATQLATCNVSSAVGQVVVDVLALQGYDITPLQGSGQTPIWIDYSDVGGQTPISMEPVAMKQELPQSRCLGHGTQPTENVRWERLL